MCTSGPSLPTASPPDTAPIAPNTFATRVLVWRIPGTLMPFRYAFTSGIPEPGQHGRPLLSAGGFRP
eukprot:scaffold1202_cov384-Prasinococcus_capsulatus_cf.AAC.2